MKPNHHTNSKWLKSYKQRLELSEIQRQVLIGTVLGDGSLKISPSEKAARLQICHSFSSKDYVFWKRQIFSEWILCEPKYYKVNNSLIFRTVSHTSIYKYQNIFYEGKTKIVPKRINSLLKSPLSLAVWFMDDGNGYLKQSAYRISTYAFGYNGNLLLQKCLSKNFGLHTSLVRDSKGFQLYFPIRNGCADRFRSLIEENIIPSMKYKIQSQPRRD